MKHLSRVGHGLVSNKGKLYFHPRGNEVLSNLLLQPLHRPLRTSFLLPLFLIPFPLPTLFLPAFTQFSRCVHFLSDLPHPCCSSVGFDPLAGFLALQRESCFLFLLVALCLCWVGAPIPSSWCACCRSVWSCHGVACFWWLIVSLLNGLRTGN